MSPLTKEEFKRAYYIWSFRNRSIEMSNSLNPFLHSEIQSFPHQKSWLKTARQNLFLSKQKVAETLMINPRSYTEMEKCEENGTISLQTLARAAEAMDCELVYAIRPKAKVTFAMVIWKKVLPKAMGHPWIRKCDPRKRPEALAAMARRMMLDPEFRREQGWSQRMSERK